MHAWGLQGPAHHPGQVEQTKWPGAEAAGRGQNVGSGRLCAKCGAWLGCLGLEPTPQMYVSNMVEVFREVRRVMRDDATLWLNCGDAFATGAGKVGSCPGGDKQGKRWTGPTTQPNRMPLPGLKAKDLIGLPWRLAFALQADGWWLRSDIIWAKPAPMPESVQDRPTKAHEYVFLLTKAATYYYDQEAIREPHATPEERRGSKNGAQAMRGQEAIRPRGNLEACAATEERYYAAGGRNKRTVWTIPTTPFPGEHFAVFPEALAMPCVLAGTSERGVCPACGAPWRREVERATTPRVTEDVAPNNRDGGLTAEDGMERTGLSHYKYAEWLAAHPPETKGWSPSCACPPAEPIPATVLDPFSGAGTTGVVALKAGRNYVGCELNPEYTEMSRKRLVATAPLFATVEVKERAEERGLQP